jgi:hypothetical protein
MGFNRQLTRLSSHQVNTRTRRRDLPTFRKCSLKQEVQKHVYCYWLRLLLLCVFMHGTCQWDLRVYVIIPQLCWGRVGTISKQSPSPSSKLLDSLTVNCQLSTVNCLLSTIYRLPSTVYCLLSTVYGLRYTVYCLLSTVNCQLSTVYCLLSTVYCRLSTVMLERYHVKKTLGNWNHSEI